MLFRKWKKRLCRYASERLSALYDKPLPPPTDREKELVAELRGVFRRLPNLEPGDRAGSEKEWLQNVGRLESLVLHNDPREFLRWDVILKTMVATHATYVGPELRYLKARPDWGVRWSEAMEECPVGHPVPDWRYPSSSANSIHHGYHLAQFEEKTGLHVDDLDFVFEFGGGYGNMCRLVHRLGFEGRYLLFDLPAFSALQNFFLKSTDIAVCSIESFKIAQTGVLCISEMEELKEILSNHTRTGNSIFIATWSISEVPVRLRDTILALVSWFRAFLIGYQARFGEVDNIEFFRQWRKQHHDVDWQDWRIEQAPGGSRYLVGKRRSQSGKNGGCYVR